MSHERSAIAHAWAVRADSDHVLGRDREGTIAEVAGWIELALAARDDGAISELAKLVALAARTAGYEGLPASVLALRLDALVEAWREMGPESFARVAPVLRTLQRVALDAHNLGSSEARDTRHIRALRDMTPVFRAASGKVVAILLGPMVPELIDGAMARVLHECQAAETSSIVIDVLGAERDDDRFHQTIAALLRDPSAYKHTVVLTGLADTERTRAGLAAAGAELSRVRLEHRLTDVLG